MIERREVATDTRKEHACATYSLKLHASFI
jgi:hypothetical protein